MVGLLYQLDSNRRTRAKQKLLSAFDALVKNAVAAACSEAEVVVNLADIAEDKVLEVGSEPRPEIRAIATMRRYSEL
jgi:hypothetical protein